MRRRGICHLVQAVIRTVCHHNAALFRRGEIHRVQSDRIPGNHPAFFQPIHKRRIDRSGKLRDQRIAVVRIRKKLRGILDPARADLCAVNNFHVITQTPEFFQLFMYVRIVVIRNNNLIFCHWLSLDFPATSMISESA